MRAAMACAVPEEKPGEQGVQNGGPPAATGGASLNNGRLNSAASGEHRTAAMSTVRCRAASTSWRAAGGAQRGCSQLVQWTRRPTKESHPGIRPGNDEVGEDKERLFRGERTKRTRPRTA